jgi:CRISPR-associated protein Cmr2
MTAHLLLVTLGPVQDFIAQARRTRDLWYGSHLLSELGRAAARALVGGGAELIFPSLKAGDAQLQPCLAPLRADGTPPQNVANKLLAEVPSGVDPQQLARAVRAAVARYWRDDLAAPVKAKCTGLLASGVDAVWTEQVDTFLEFAASWSPLAGYAQTRRQIEQAIAGRKMLRDFGAWTHGRGSVPKSSLDGARETVLLPPKARQATLARKYRIGEGEQLDAIGLVKRAGGEPDQFVPVINVALASWVDLVSRVAPSELDGLRAACRNAGVSRVARTDLPCTAPFPFDASVLLASRWRSVFDEQGLDGNAESWGRQHVQPILGKVSEPYPYVACLVADGDHMGRAIDRLGSAHDHRTFSEALARFASDARKVVEQNHRGALVYAGGDDVLAFLPLPEALSCAEDLRKNFAGAMASACESIPAEQRPTLSVGLGIGHVMESMGDLLALGRQAEREAKRDRNALAVLVDKRSGGTRTWHAQWSADPVGTLHDATALLQDRLPSRKVYEIASTLARLPEPGEDEGGGWARVLALEVGRSLARVEGGALRPESAGLALDAGAGYAALHARVRAWVARLLIARTFAQATPRERRRGEEVAA